MKDAPVFVLRDIDTTLTPLGEGQRDTWDSKAPARGAVTGRGVAVCGEACRQIS